MRESIPLLPSDAGDESETQSTTRGLTSMSSSIDRNRRRANWYAKNTRFNPFSRSRPRQSEPDAENTARHSDSFIPQQTGSAELTGDIEDPQRAATTPIASGANWEASTSNGTEVGSLPITDENRPSRRGRFPISRGNTTGLEAEYTPTTASAKQSQEFTFLGQIRATLFSSWINILLIFVPAGVIVHFLHVSPVVVFVVNFIAIIPLAAMLSFATEELSLRVGETLGGLLNATFGYVEIWNWTNSI
ncbi:MAG: hypothetical protein M1840_007035 [Geoglossum simile]|nr:MAG: hypothetical protein M1840_007035 [Geoglossum simile]